MCGITGIIAFNENGKKWFDLLPDSLRTLSKRGPDAHGIFRDERVALGHARLAIIDTSVAGNQPMTIENGRFTIVYNGEVFNFLELRKELQQSGVTFFSNSDTEVIIHLYRLHGEKFLSKLNGFFALAIYDKEEQSVFIARDRTGIKPLVYYHDQNVFLFGSELKALMTYPILRAIDQVSMRQYFQLTYTPAPHTIYKNIYKLEPGHQIKIRNSNVEMKKWYSLPYSQIDESVINSMNYEQSQKKLIDLLDSSVQRRLISDVPLGAFLSGGIDSSAIVALASRHTNKLNTFSIGFADDPFFDETNYADLVAKKFNTNHTVYKLNQSDMLQSAMETMDYLDEPFADSSAIAVNVLSKNTRKHVTVALSGDGADELFGGYNKHHGEYLIRNKGTKVSLMKMASPLLKLLPSSRNSVFGNKIRQAKKMAAVASMNPHDRYWQLASFLDEKSAEELFMNGSDSTELGARKNYLLRHLNSSNGHSIEDMNRFFYTDVQMMLPNDMLTKVDMMSMRNSLEVRVPFLDYTVVEFAFSLPLDFKIDGKSRKKILRDAFRNILPVELYHRPKQGFEVPLLRWFRNDLKNLIMDDLLSEKFIKAQGIFDFDEIDKYKKRVFSNNPGDVAIHIWTLIVFQSWWKKYFGN